MEKSEPNSPLAPTQGATAAADSGSRPNAGATDAKSEKLVVDLEEQIRETKQRVADLQLELADARRKPLSVLRDLAKYKVLSFLSQKTAAPPRMAARFHRSATKRDPLRSLPDAMRTKIEAETANAQRFAHMIETSTALQPDPAKPTVMVVSHEASRTGAPILALNIAQTLADKYNVVVVTLGGGILRDDFKATAVAMYELDNGSKEKVTGHLQKICARHDFAYALVNSAESRNALPGLKAAGVPTVALLHEFASYTRPRTAFSDIFRDADQVVFSTRITLENALEQYGIERGTAIHVLPQGKCIVPSGKLSEVERDRERRWLDSVLRPNGDDEREFVVLGAGTIEQRKAVELFLECATRVIGSPGGGRFRFVWIGGGYNPEKDTSMSAYLADQIKRAGIQSQVSIVRPTSEIEHAYRLADVLLLSSRLDPLPNVAIDALIAGTPVLCFERTTGIADFLLECGLGQDCVAQYIDTKDMAQKVLALADDPAHLADVGARGREAAFQRFDLGRYIDTLDAIGTTMVPTVTQIAEDTEFLLASDRFRTDSFCLPEEDPRDTGSAVRRYLEASRSGQRMRKPAPGFNPGIYAALHEKGAGADPFVRFLRDGTASGPWSLPVIDGHTEISAKAVSGLRAALHLHVTAPEKVAEIMERLSRNTARPDIFVSTTAECETQVRAALAEQPFAVKAIEIVPGRGRAIGALVTGFGPLLASDYELIGQIHTDTAEGGAADPSTFLLENLIGGDQGGAMLDRILTAMGSDSSLGIVYPADPNVVNWGDSRAAADHLARRLGLSRLPDQIDFPTSGMFWVRSAALLRFTTLNLGWADYPAWQLDAQDTAIAALPRLFSVVPALDGMASAVTNVAGLTRSFAHSTSQKEN